MGELHESRRLPVHHCTMIDGVPVTTLARTLFDLAGATGLHDARVERALDNALAATPPLLPRLHRMLVELSTHGRPGLGLMRDLLAERPVGYVPPASGLEARVVRILDDACIPTDRQVDLGDDDWIGRVDLRIVGTPVVIEVDSARFHSSLTDRRRDAHRDERLQETGIRVVRLTEEEVFSRPWVVEQRVRRAVEEVRRSA